MTVNNILPSISRMQPGDNYCGLYRTDEDYTHLVDFVREGIARKMLRIHQSMAR